MSKNNSNTDQAKQSCKTGVSGGFFFYLLYSAEKGRKTHIQHEDGSKPCKCKKARLSDGSMDKIEYVDGIFRWWQYDRMGASYGKPYIIQTIPNPITCVKCQEWLLQNQH